MVLIKEDKRMLNWKPRLVEADEARSDHTDAYTLRLFLDKIGYSATRPNINIVAIRERWGCTHFASASVCLACFARQSKYRQEVRTYLRFALSDACIERPELRLMFQQAGGHC